MTNAISEHEDKYSNDIAIIGMSGRFPGAENIPSLWKNLKNGVDSISSFTEVEQRELGVDPKLLKNSNYIKARPILSNVENFDASFFGFTARDAEILDPQIRLFLECSWEVFENAAYDIKSCKSHIGVFAGSSLSQYLLYHLFPKTNAQDTLSSFETLIGNDKDYLSSYIAYKLDLKGPCLNVQSACSTSLVATHLACQSLLNHECDMALAGGTTIRTPQKLGYLYQNGGIFSRTGQCRSFDASADGLIFGNGVGVVLLKRLSDSIKDRDHIYAVIKGSAVNNDGASRVGFTAPGVDGQAEVVAEALALSNVTAESIDYIECHGTGTRLGDSMELTAMTQAFRASTEKKQFCAIGSIKSNVGHLECAAGVAGLIKTVLALKNKILPPSLHYKTPNPEFNFNNSPFFVNTKLSEWKSNGHPRRAGVSIFGIGGTNAHIVLEEAPSIEPTKTSQGSQLLVLSAKTSTALETMTDNLCNYLEKHPNTKLSEIAYSLQVGRARFPHRRILVSDTVEKAKTLLSSRNPKKVRSSHQEATRRKTAFVFSGSTHLYPQLAQGLYETEDYFRKIVDQCAEVLRPLLGTDIRKQLYTDTETSNQTMQKMQTTPLAEPMLFTTQYALAKLWMHWSVTPAAILGDELGELVGACLAEVFKLEEALRIVSQRDPQAGNSFPNKVEYHSPKIPLISSATGTWITQEQATTHTYWSKRHVTENHFLEGIAELLKDPETLFIDFDPEQKLKTIIQKYILKNQLPNRITIPCIRTFRDRKPDQEYLLQAFGRLWLTGYPIDWKQYHGQQIQRIPLPTYPFERKRYWVEPELGLVTSHKIIKEKRTNKTKAPSSSKLTNLIPRPSNLTTPFVSPRNEIEKTITQIWQDFIGLEQVGIHDNFFDLGGDSFLATRIMAKVLDKYPIDFSIRNFIEEPTIAAIAKAIKLKEYS